MDASASKKDALARCDVLVRECDDATRALTESNVARASLARASDVVAADFRRRLEETVSLLDASRADAEAARFAAAEASDAARETADASAKTASELASAREESKRLAADLESARRAANVAAEETASTRRAMDDERRAAKVSEDARLAAVRDECDDAMAALVANRDEETRAFRSRIDAAERRAEVAEAEARRAEEATAKAEERAAKEEERAAKAEERAAKAEEARDRAADDAAAKDAQLAEYAAEAMLRRDFSASASGFAPSPSPSPVERVDAREGTFEREGTSAADVPPTFFLAEERWREEAASAREEAASAREATARAEASASSLRVAAGRAEDRAIAAEAEVERLSRRVALAEGRAAAAEDAASSAKKRASVERRRAVDAEGRATQATIVARAMTPAKVSRRETKKETEDGRADGRAKSADDAKSASVFAFASSSPTSPTSPTSPASPFRAAAASAVAAFRDAAAPLAASLSLAETTAPTEEEETRLRERLRESVYEIERLRSKIQALESEAAEAAEAAAADAEAAEAEAAVEATRDASFSVSFGRASGFAEDSESTVSRDVSYYGGLATPEGFSFGVVGAETASNTPETPPGRSVRRLRAALGQRDRELRQFKRRCETLEAAVADRTADEA